MALGTNVNCGQLPKDSNFDVYIRLTRLTEEDIARVTNMKKRNQPSSSDSNYQNVTIKQEPQDSLLDDTGTENYRNTVENNTWPEYGPNNKVEDVNLNLVKSESPDAYENYLDNSPTISNHNDIFSNEYNCGVCFAIFYDKEEFIVHKNLIHKPLPYVCTICNSKFSLSAHLSTHLHEHFDIMLPVETQSSTRSNLKNTNKNHKNIKSSIEPKVQNKKLQKNVSAGSPQSFSTSSKIHLQKTVVFKPFKCTNCVFTTKSESKFLLHQNICTNIQESGSRTINGSNQCRLCSKSFINQTSLNGHMRFHSLRGEIISKRQFQASRKREFANQKVNGSVVSSQKVISTKKSQGNVVSFYKCKDCNKKFISSNKLNVHQLQHKRQLMCAVCNKQFFLQKSYEKHLLSHKDRPTGGKQNDCNTSFNESHSSGDQRTYGGIIKCKFVPKTVEFKNSGAESKKLNRLVKSKPYPCLYCKNYYKSKKSLSEHTRHFHANLRPTFGPPKSPSSKCQWCSAIITKSNLYRHIRSFHPQARPVNCNYCSMKFKDFPSRKIHIHQYHKN